MSCLISSFLRSLGITRNYFGYFFTLYAAQLACEDEMRLANITRDIYRPVAERFSCQAHCVERNIRTVIYLAWRNNRDLLCRLAGYELSAPPSVSRFIDILTSAAQRQD